MTHAAPPPGSYDDMVVAMMRAYWQKPEMEILYIYGDDGGWDRAADLVQAWIAYERDLTRYAIDSKLQAEHERAIEEAAQVCDVLGEKLQASPAFNTMAGWCSDAIRALKVIP